MDVQGAVAPGFEPVRDLLQEVVDSSPGTGSAVAAWYDGAWVVDLWGGWVDRSRARPWRRDSLVMPYSVSKVFAAVGVLLLVDRGRVALDEPMATYWPQLRAPATVRQMLSHAAGLVLLDEPAPTEALFDWDRMCALIARQEPTWPPGQGIGESALLFGHLCGQLVRLVDGRSLGRFLRDELGLDFHFGLVGDELDRAVDLTGYGADFRARDEEDRLMTRALSNPPGALDPDVVNSRAWRSAEIPAVNGHGTARAVAELLVRLARGGLLSPALLDEMTNVAVTGHDRVVGAPVSWGLGVSVEPGDGWGMGGTGGSLCWWSEAGGYALAFLTGHIAGHDRGDRVENAVRAVIGLEPV